MASHNVVFAIDVDYRSEGHSLSKDEYRDHLKRWTSRFLLSLGSKYGFEKVRWGYTFFHSRTVKNGGLITRGTDFRELHEKVFGDFEAELLAKFAVSEKTSDKVHHSRAGSVQNTLKEIILDFQWDRPDITSPTKPTLRPRRSIRNTKKVPLTDDEHSCVGRNVLFVVSECPRSRRDLEEFTRSGDGERYKDLVELVLPKRLIDMMVQRNVVLHWADSGSLKVDHGVGDCVGLKAVMHALQLVAGKVLPMLSPGSALNHTHPNPSTLNEEAICSFPSGSTTAYILSSEKTYKRAFPSLVGTLCWGADEGRQSCIVSLEPVSCGQKLLRASVEVTLRSVLHGLDTCSFRQLASECWILLCPDKPEQDRASFQCLLQELSVQASNMLAEVCAGGQIYSAVVSVLSPNTALLTVLQPLVTETKEVVGISQTTHDAMDLPDVVSSVLNVMYDIMEDDEKSEQTNQHRIPDWANQELQQWTNLKADLAEGWFPLSDQSGISCHLMQSMRLLHAPSEEEEQRDLSTQQELTHSLAEFYQNSTAGPSTGPRGKKRGAQRTPVRQKMKTMSRSLQMLNFARFTVKAQKSQAETDSSSAARGPVKRSARGTGERTSVEAIHFKSEEELLSHLKLRYQQAVEDKSIPLLTQVQGLLSLVTSFMKSHADAQASFSDLIKMSLLKSTQTVRQIYGSAPDVDRKIRDCQLQVVLRLELCRQASAPQDPDHMEPVVEEMAGMLRIISLTNDPVYLAKFMKEDILPLYLNSIPKVLADIYHSLGTQLPDELAAVLPPDFFSDDSMAKESVSVSPLLLSATQSLGSNAGDRLEELRDRSAKKRRTSMLTRHKSMTEAPQTLRQIEMPRRSSRQAKPTVCVPSEKSSVKSQPPQKPVQEVTKVRRNLFNQETVSPTKSKKMPRSQSVSAVEGLKKRKRSQMEDEPHSLLTKKVSETPLHKQVSNRLLHRQKSGRRSGETDMFVIEESPVKPAAGLRRSPRIKNLARRHSSVFYSSSQSRSRNLDRAMSSSQLAVFEDKGGINVNVVKSPMRLLFGAAQSPGNPSSSPREPVNSKEVRLGSARTGFENLNKTPRKSPYKQSDSVVGSRAPQTPGRIPCSTAKGSEAFSSDFSEAFISECAIGENRMVLRGSPFRSPAAKSLELETPKKSPLKGILRTPVKNFMECGTISGSCLVSPSMRTPRKSVTWSPSPHKCMSEKTFKVPESPQSSNRCSPRLTPRKLCTIQADVFNTNEKLCQRKCRFSPEMSQRGSEITGNKELKLVRRSHSMKRILSLPEKSDPQSAALLSVDSSPPPSGKNTPKNSPGPSHRMCTRSGRTPPKCSSSPPHYKSKVIRSSSPLLSNVSLPVNDKLSELILGSQTSGSHVFDSSSCQSISANCSKFNQALNREPQSTNAIERQNESAHEMTEGGSSSSSSDTQQFDSFQFSGTTTEESIDITEASVVKTELTGGLKMNIAFSRKSSRNEVFEFRGTQALPAETTQGCSYGFRQTPDRQQRKAAARLGYSPGLPVFSTPQCSPTNSRMKTLQPNPLTYQVELEMQETGLPKLKFKRTDSFNLGEAPDNVAKNSTPLMNTKTSRSDSPLAHCSKHREPLCISPSLCTRGTPGKGGLQTYICQSITPTRIATNSPSSSGPGEHVSWTPSPQKRGLLTPENFSSWPRRKRARTAMLGTKETGTKVESDILDSPELDGVFRLQGEEEIKGSNDAPAFKHALDMRSRLCTTEEIDWSESVLQSCDRKDAVKYEELSLKTGKGSAGSVVTPPSSSKVKKSVSVSGILALTQSPLLYKGKKGGVTKDAAQTDESIGNTELCGNKGFMMDTSPFNQSRRQQRYGRTCSRKRLLES
ncbi:treslin [Brachyhypopomus gauderio]|uniref:treslin n=1 Tax=Brachyhypopomus gauderio TaxID=698409 RepID=UPI004042B364